MIFCNTKKLLSGAFVILLCQVSYGQQNQLYKPIDQPDADGRIIRGREGTHHWQPYMSDADLTGYHHAPDSAYEAFRDMKYGLRIHWGIYSIVHGRESWILTQYKDDRDQSLEFQGLYNDLYKSWNPSGFDADRWTDMMARDGFKFFVFTTKHHDGFSMYDTKTLVTHRTRYYGAGAGNTETCNLHYSIMETPFGRDVTGELISAARKKGLKIGIYFSHPDWYDADFRFDEWNPNRDTTYTPESDPVAWKRFETRHEQQLEELLTQYGKIDLLSLDMWFPQFAWGHMQALMKDLRKVSPATMFRWRGIGNYGDYQTPENYIPGDESIGSMPWQVIHALSTRNYFSYEPDEQYYRNGQWIVSKLIDIVSKGGNLMIGIGPDLQGNFHPKALEALRYAGEWLMVNGEAIYKTRPCKYYHQGDSIHFTRSKDSRYLYAMVEGWPGNSIEFDHIIPRKRSEIYMLGYEVPLKWKKDREGVRIFIPADLQDPGKRPCRQAWAFRIAGTME